MFESEIIPRSTCIASLRAQLSACATKPYQVSNSRGNLTYTLSLKIKLLEIQIRASIDFYPCRLFQILVFNERREIVATVKQNDNTTTVLVAPPTEDPRYGLGGFR